jgi:hypothetical protein
MYIISININYSFCMKRKLFIGVLLSFLLFPTTVLQAQFLRTSYFMDGTNARYKLNPALSPRRGFFNFPGIGSIMTEVSTNSLGSQDVIDILNSDQDFLQSDAFISKLTDMNTANISANVDALSFGWHSAKSFWSFSITARVDIDGQIPKSMFEMIKTVGAPNFVWNRDQRFDIRDQHIKLNSYVEVGIGWSRAFGKSLNIGVRPKLLLGAAGGNLKINSLSMIGASRSDQGVSFNTTSDAYLEYASNGFRLHEEDGYISTGTNGSIEWQPAGYGAGIDVGVGLQLFNHLNLSAALLDLGFINWTPKSIQIARSNPDAVNRTKYDSPELIDWGLLHMKEETGTEKSLTSHLSPTLVLGGEYSVFNNKLGVGVLSTTRFGQLENYSELTLSANWRPNTLFNLSGSYSLLNGYDTFGLALMFGPVIVGSDYVFLGKNSKHVNVYAGVSIPLGKKRQ